MKDVLSILKKKYNKYRVLSYHYFYPRLCSIMDKNVNGKYLVIESDDWGSIRMPSLSVYNCLIQDGYDFSSHPFEKFDSIERDNDIADLAAVLLNHKDSFGNHPKFTLDTVVCNPNFKEIYQKCFTEYIPETINETYSHYEGSSNVLALIKKGVEEGVFDIQYHACEHFNVHHWMENLQNNIGEALYAFNIGMCGLPSKNISKGNSLLLGLKYSSIQEKKYMEKRIVEGINIFSKIFDASPTSFVAPCYWWDGSIEPLLSNEGVKLIQTTREWGNVASSQIMYHYSGEKNSYGQIYSIRNCMFEPATLKNKSSCVDDCLSEINSAFKRKKIAVVSSHRLNYIGRIFESNKTESLMMLDELLSKVVSQYPDVQFVSTSQLYNILK